MKYYKIAIYELKKTYTYKSDIPLQPGTFCAVKVRGKEYIGVIVEEESKVDLNISYLPIKKVFDEFPVLPDEFINFIKTISGYYFVDYAWFFSIAFPSKMFKGIEYVYSITKKKQGLFFTDDEAVIISALEKKPLTLKELNNIAGKDIKVVLKNLVNLGIVKKEIADPFRKSESSKRKAVTLVKMPDEITLEKYKNKSPNQYKILDYLNRHKGINFFLISELSEILNVSYQSFKKLEEKGFVKCFYDYPSIVKDNPSIKEVIQLTNHQKDFVEKFKSNPEGIFYLYGVTGSGKTEVYLRCAEWVIKNGKTVLYLVPEIGLTPSAISRLKIRFGRDIAIIHSGLSYGERISEWLRVLNNKVKIVVGTRSAVFAPLKELGLIIIDEEHDHSYKQENFPKYNAVHSCLFRAKNSNIPIILGSATPSVESFYHANEGKYKLFTLPERAGSATLPEVEIVDMMKEFEKSGGKKNVFSQKTLDEIKKSLENNEQVLIFVNRRGFAPFLMCRRCGNIEMCPNCSVSLTVHSGESLPPLQCHYCGYGKSLPDVCPECGDNFIQMIGYGTQRVEQKLKIYFPSARVERIDRDTVSSKNAFELFVRKMRKKEIDIVVGTQMISKGHHFPYLRLAVVIDADSLIAFPDFRSTERAFSLLMQVGGRAGRELKGKVLIQTYKPEHQLFKFVKNHDYISFFKNEIIFRKKAGYPPFSRLIVLEIKGQDEKRVEEIAEMVGERLQKFNNFNKVNILGPVKASIYKIHNRYRYHIILKSNERKSLRELFFKAVLPFLNKKLNNVVIVPDFDPYSIM